MALDRIKEAALPGIVTNTVSDLADLFHKEMRLARAEISEKIATKLQAGAWISGAGIMALLAALLVVEAAAFAIASTGLPLYWSCLILALIAAAIAVVLFAKGRSNAKIELTPTRTMNQVRRDIATAKEQLS
jgi:Putative Actinobacterial Holin-X, holin superfamily III